MKITVEELKQCKNVTDDLIEKVNARIVEVCSDYDEHNHLEDDFGFDYNGISYDVIEVEQSNWDDQGKYQYQDITYQLVSYDKNIKPFPYTENIIDKFDLFLELGVTRSGSYFTDYYYSYDNPIINIAKIKHIPEQIIPAHDVVEFIIESK